MVRNTGLAYEGIVHVFWLILALSGLTACKTVCNCIVEPEETGSGAAADTGTASCGDVDGDGVCDAEDLCVGHDVSGDTDSDGVCNDLDQDDDGDGVDDADDDAPTYAYACSDTDKDGCEDCSSGSYNTDYDGDDYDRDGICDDGDTDDDNDGIDDAQDSDPLNPYRCGDSDNDTCEDCLSGVSDPLNDGDDWNNDGICDAIDPKRFVFADTQTVDGRTITCSSTSSTTKYTECTDLLVDGLYFTNRVSCDAGWSTEDSPSTSHADFCELLTDSDDFEVFYTCDVTRERATYSGGSWGTNEDNGYTKSVRCHY